MVAPLSIDESPTLRTWTVSAPGHQPETLMAENWLTALGRALDALDVPPCTGRMAAEVLRVLCVTPEHADRYAGTLFAADEAHRGACTARSTVYCANIAAGWMIHQFTRWLRGWPVDFDLTLNLLAGELTVEDAAR